MIFLTLNLLGMICLSVGRAALSTVRVGRSVAPHCRGSVINDSAVNDVLNGSISAELEVFLTFV